MPSSSLIKIAIFITTVSVIGSVEAEESVSNCVDTFQTEEFNSLRLVEEHDTTKLTAKLSILLGQHCTIDQLQDFLTSKFAVLDRKTDEYLYMFVTTSTKLLKIGELRLSTSIIVRFENEKIAFINAGVAK